MSAFSGHQILNQVREAFIKHGGENGLSREQFVRIMLQFIPEVRTIKGDTNTVVELLDKFADIDVDGNGYCDWPEYLAHTVEAGIVSTRKATVPLTHKFAVADRFIDTTTRAPISKIQYAGHPLDCFLVIEERSSKLRLYSATAMKLICDIDTVTSPKLKGRATDQRATDGSAEETLANRKASMSVPGSVIAQVHREKASAGEAVSPFVNAACLIEESGLLAVAQSNNLIALWTSPGLAAFSASVTPAESSVGDSKRAAAASKHGSPQKSQGPARRVGRNSISNYMFSLAATLQTGVYPALHIAWGGGVLFSGSNSGKESVISVWDVQECTLLARFLCHDNALTDMTVVPQHNVLVTASMERSISVYELRQWNDQQEGHAASAKAPPLKVLTAKNIRAMTEQGSTLVGVDAGGVPGSAPLGHAAGNEADDEQPREDGDATQNNIKTALKRSTTKKKVSGDPTTTDAFVDVTDSDTAGYRMVARMTGHAQGVRQIAYIASADLLLSAAYDLDALGFDLNTNKQVLRFRGHRVPLVGVQEVPPHGVSQAVEAIATAKDAPEKELDNPLAGLSAHSDSQHSQGRHRGPDHRMPKRRMSGSNRSRALTLDLANISKLWDLSPSFTGLATCLMTIDLNILSASPSGNFFGAAPGPVMTSGTAVGRTSQAQQGITSAKTLSFPKTASAATVAKSLVKSNRISLVSAFKSLKALAKSGAAAAAAAAAAGNVVAPGKSVPRTFAVAMSSGVLVIGSMRLALYLPVRATIVDTYAVTLTTAVWNSVSRTILTANDRTIRVFDMKGVRIHQWFNIVPSPITAMILDGRCRKLIIGTQSGMIFVHNASNGVLMKMAETQHSSEVSALHYIPSAKAVASVSWDRNVIIHDESPQYSLELVKMWEQAHAGDISCVAVSPHEQSALIASAGADFVVKLHDINTGRLEAVLEGHLGEITQLHFVEDYPLLVSADTTGTIIVWGIRPCGMDYLYRPVAAFKHLQVKDDKRGDARARSTIPPEGTAEYDELFPLLQGSKIDRLLAYGVPVTAITSAVVPWASLERVGEEELKRVVITCDENGRVRIWDITPVIQAAKIPSYSECSSMLFEPAPADTDSVDDVGCEGGAVDRRAAHNSYEHVSADVLLMAKSLASRKQSMQPLLAPEGHSRQVGRADRQRRRSSLQSVSALAESHLAKQVEQMENNSGNDSTIVFVDRSKGAESLRRSSSAPPRRASALGAVDLTRRNSRSSIQESKTSVRSASGNAFTGSASTLSKAMKSRKNRYAQLASFSHGLAPSELLPRTRSASPVKGFGATASHQIHTEPAAASALTVSDGVIGRRARSASLTMEDFELALRPKEPHSRNKNKRASFVDIVMIARALVASVECTSELLVLQQWQAHADVVRSVQVIFDTGVVSLLTAAQDGTVRLWALNSAEALGNLVPVETLGTTSESKPQSPPKSKGANDQAPAGTAISQPEIPSINVKLPWRFHIDDTERVAYKQAAADELLAAIRRVDDEAARKAKAKQDRQMKLQQEIAAAGRSMTPSTLPMSSRRNRAASSFGTELSPAVEVGSRPGIALADLLSPRESCKTLLALGEQAPPSVVLKAVHGLSSAPGGNYSAAVAGGDFSFLKQRRETLKLLDELIGSDDAVASRADGAGAEIPVPADTDLTQLSLGHDEQEREPDDILHVGIVETSAATKTIGKAPNKTPSDAAGQYTALASISTEALLESLSSERKAATLLAAHLAMTGQKPLIESYGALQSEKARGLGPLTVKKGSTRRPGIASTPAQQDEHGHYRVKFTAAGDVDTTPSAFLAAKLSSRSGSQLGRARPSSITQLLDTSTPEKVVAPAFIARPRSGGSTRTSTPSSVAALRPPRLDLSSAKKVQKQSIATGRSAGVELTGLELLVENEPGVSHMVTKALAEMSSSVSGGTNILPSSRSRSGSHTARSAGNPSGAGGVPVALVSNLIRTARMEAGSNGFGKTSSMPLLSRVLTSRSRGSVERLPMSDLPPGHTRRLPPTATQPLTTLSRKNAYGSMPVLARIREPVLESAYPTALASLHGPVKRDALAREWQDRKQTAETIMRMLEEA